jgi:hypothetical protein
MGGPAQREPEHRETTREVFTRELAARGFTADQSRQILDIVQRMRAGQHVELNPVQSNWVGDINAINNAWTRVSPTTRRLTQLTPAQATEICTGREMRERDRARKVDNLVAESMDRMAATIRARPAPAQVNTFVYEVRVQGQEYRVELNRELTRAGMITSDIRGSRIGQLERILAGNPGAVLAVTLPNGTTVRSGTPEFAAFAQTYVQNYVAMSRELSSGQDSDRISISSVRRRREG